MSSISINGNSILLVGIENRVIFENTTSYHTFILSANTIGFNFTIHTDSKVFFFFHHDHSSHLSYHNCSLLLLQVLPKFLPASALFLIVILNKIERVILSRLIMTLLFSKYLSGFLSQIKFLHVYNQLLYPHLSIPISYHAVVQVMGSGD